LLAEGEFAQVKYHLKTGIERTIADRGSLSADLDSYGTAVDAAARAEDKSWLSKYLPSAEEIAVDVKHDLFIAVVNRAHGVAHRLDGEWDLAADRLATATEEFRALETPWQIGRTLLELGRVEQHRGNVEPAREHYLEAISQFESLGATPHAERARAALEALN
jgi:hypothetical protein